MPSNPLHDLVAPRAKDTTNRGSAPLVTGPQAGPCSIHSRGGRGAVRAPMCPLTPCMTLFFFDVDQFEHSSGPGHHPMQCTVERNIHTGGGEVMGHGSCGTVPMRLALSLLYSLFRRCCGWLHPLHHVPRTRRTEGARSLSWAPKRGHIPSNSGGGWVQYGPPCAL